jgi:beta-lactam-binding protein with PASTA domain
MVVVLALAFSLSAIVTIYTLFRSGNTEVPNVVGKPEAEAQKLAEQAGLRVKIQHRNDSSVTPNSVIETRPGPRASVKKESVLTIVVSSGPIQTKSQVRAPSGSSPGRRHQFRRFSVDEVRGLIGSIMRVSQ